jgi:hypothetical protein
MYPFYIPPELYEALGPVVVPLPHPKKGKKTSPPPNTPFPEDVYWAGAAGPPPAATAPLPLPAATTPPPVATAPPQTASAPPPAKPPSRLKAMLPDLAMAAAAVAQRMAQPRQVGESDMMAATQALVQGYNTLAQLQWMRYAQQMAQRQQQLQELKTLADIARTRAETEKTIEEAKAVRPTTEAKLKTAEAREKEAQAREKLAEIRAKEVEVKLQLGEKQLALEAAKAANQAAAKQDELKLEAERVKALRDEVDSLVRSRAAQTEINKARLKLDQAELELKRKQAEAYMLTAQAKVLEAASGGVHPEKLRADLYKLAYESAFPDESEKERMSRLRIADMYVDAYAKKQQGPQPVASPPSGKGARLVQPSSDEYIRAIETSNGEVYELRRDGQWFRTR